MSGPSVWIEEARLRLDDARRLLERDRPARAVSTAYFACHAAGRGLLRREEVYAHTHSGLRNRIGYHFVRTERCPSDTTQWLAELEQLRQEADYELRAFSEQEATSHLETADRCVRVFASVLESG
jgi:uncharacterized protein (UPF0332 family)